MKKLFAIAVLGLIVLASCKKSSVSGNGSIQATVNDTVQNFNILGGGDIYDGGQEVDLWAYNSTNASKAYSIYFELRSNSVIAAGGVFTDTASYQPLPIGYKQINDVEYGPQIQAPNSYIYFYPAYLYSNPFVITVTSISTTSIQGTFHGTLYISGDSTSTADSIKTFTNGKFNMPLALQN